jgi:hypothetical protein
MNLGLEAQRGLGGHTHYVMQTRVSVTIAISHFFFSPSSPIPEWGHSLTLTNVSSRLFEANLRDVLHLAQAIRSSPPMFVPT